MSSPKKDVGTVFAYFDGDDVGSRLELLLLDNRLGEARRYSQQISLAIAEVRDRLATIDSVEVSVFGGDDLVASWAEGKVNLTDIELVRKAFFAISGRTLSVGVGVSPRDAIWNLRRAKLMGKNRTVSSGAIIQ